MDKISYIIICRSIDNQCWTHLDHWGREAHFDFYEHAEKQAKAYLEDKTIDRVDIMIVERKKIKTLTNSKL